MKVLDRHFGRLGNRLFQLAYVQKQAENGEITDIYVQDEEVTGKMKEILLPSVIDSNYVAIHVRRGDYVGNPFYVDLMSTDYYERAMAEFPGMDFRVFSDDPEWCKRQPVFKDCMILEGTEEEDFFQMAGCDGIIMANSSFSWWAAFLNRGKVIAPLGWYSDGINRTKLLESWKRI